MTLTVLLYLELHHTSYPRRPTLSTLFPSMALFLKLVLLKYNVHMEVTLLNFSL